VDRKAGVFCNKVKKECNIYRNPDGALAGMIMSGQAPEAGPAIITS